MCVFVCVGLSVCVSWSANGIYPFVLDQGGNDACDWP